MNNNEPEYWLSGPVAGIPPLLQPVAHALLQARREVQAIVAEFPEHLLWEKPAGLASVGFHLQHLRGVLDRLFTYARGQSLTPDQFSQLKGEGQPASGAASVRELLAAFNQQVEKSLQQLTQTAETTLTEIRLVGRAAVPSTTIGLLVHAAEHTMRHTGQLLVTVRILQA
ncbi:MAG: DinB family protein [Chitinophagaceae bacterium]|nr:DinB family protein [Chitinophagaceae bacterium]